MAILVDVTESDIRSGVPRSTLVCPVALAIRRATGANYVSVGSKEFAFAHSDDFTSSMIYNGPLPEGVMEWMKGFDDGKDTLAIPFCFTITPLETR